MVRQEEKLNNEGPGGSQWREGPGEQQRHVAISQRCGRKGGIQCTGFSSYPPSLRPLFMLPPPQVSFHLSEHQPPCFAPCTKVWTPQSQEGGGLPSGSQPGVSCSPRRPASGRGVRSHIPESLTTASWKSRVLPSYPTSPWPGLTNLASHLFCFSPLFQGCPMDDAVGGGGSETSPLHPTTILIV